jgi:hypothetical protein
MGDEGHGKIQHFSMEKKNPMKNGDLPMKNGNFPMKNGDLPMKNGGYLSIDPC